MAAAHVSASIVVIIIVLTIIFFLSAFLHLLIRWLARNPSLIPRRRQDLRQSAHSSSSNRIIALTALQGQLQQLFTLQDAGLDRSLIEELPVFSYKVAMDGLREGADCAICLCEFAGDDQLRLLPLCGHAFHTECIDAWLFSHSTCPLCRALLLPECLISDALQPLLSSEISTTGEADHQPIADNAVLAVSGRHSTGLSASSRRSSIGPVTIIAGSTFMDHNHIHQTAEPRLIPVNPLNPITNYTDLANLEDPNVPNPASIAIISSRGLANSARFASLDPERSHSFTKIGNVYVSCELEDCANCKINKVANEGAISANETNSAIMVNVDSGHFRYTSLGTQSETYNETDRASAYGSGRRVAVHLGKCRMVRAEGNSMSKASGAASERCFSKGSYEYVIDSTAGLEIRISQTAIGSTPELAESSAATSMRAIVGSDEAFSPEMVVSQRLMMGSNAILAELEPANHGVVSFRLPTPASHDVLRARLKASASRRALSESEALSHWEPRIREQNVDHATDGQRLCVDDNTGSHGSSSFARRTMDWLVGWQKRTVHPEKSLHTGCSYLA